MRREGQYIPSANNASEEQTSEMISNLTMTQLLYILQRIQQLSFHSAEHAKKLLMESPQLALALIHAQYVVGGKNLDSHLLPLTQDEVKIIKDRVNRIRLAESNPAAQVNLVGVGADINQDVGLSRKFQLQQNQPADQATELSKLLIGLDPTVLAKVMESVTGGAAGELADVDAMVQTLMNLSTEQIATLPESVQLQVLKLLEESLAV
jgi:ABC-type dipeptide/oligopeptide/nickel transport system ATPase subunit